MLSIKTTKFKRTSEKERNNHSDKTYTRVRGSEKLESVSTVLLPICKHDIKEADDWR